MHHAILAVLFLVAGPPVQAVQLDVVPTDGKAAAVVKTSSEGRWLILTDRMMPVAAQSFLLASGGSIVYWEGNPGDTFGVIFIPNDTSEGLAARQVKLGYAPQPPPDPEPTPDPDPDPIPPPSPTAWKVTGLHMMVVDDENLRGNLPQSQVNVFTSTTLREWMESNGAKYRFSSNDSLKPGEPARELEKPEFVAGWDLVSAAVAEGKVKLPAWIVGNGKQTLIQELPIDVNTVLVTLEKFK